MSHVVGGFSYGMSTFEMAGAYATLANNGIYTEPYLYTRVLDAEGNVLLEKNPSFVKCSNRKQLGLLPIS